MGEWISCGAVLEKQGRRDYAERFAWVFLLFLLLSETCEAEGVGRCSIFIPKIEEIALWHNFPIPVTHENPVIGI